MLPCCIGAHAQSHDLPQKRCRSQQWSFTTLPEVGTRARVRIGVFGDLGQTAYSAQTLTHLAAESPQIILNMGEPPWHCVRLASSIAAFPGGSTVAPSCSAAATCAAAGYAVGHNCAAPPAPPRAQGANSTRHSCSAFHKAPQLPTGTCHVVACALSCALMTLLACGMQGT